MFLSHSSPGQARRRRLPYSKRLLPPIPDAMASEPREMPSSLADAVRRFVGPAAAEPSPVKSWSASFGHENDVGSCFRINRCGREGLGAGGQERPHHDAGKKKRGRLIHRVHLLLLTQF